MMPRGEPSPHDYQSCKSRLRDASALPHKKQRRDSIATLRSYASGLHVLGAPALRTPWITGRSKRQRVFNFFTNKLCKTWLETP